MRFFSFQKWLWASQNANAPQAWSISSSLTLCKAARAIWDFQTHDMCYTSSTTCSLHIPQQLLVIFLLRAWLIRHLLCLYWTLNRNTLTQVGRIQCEHGITGLSLSRSDPHVCLANLSDAPPLLIDFKAQETVALAYPSAGETLIHLLLDLWCIIRFNGSVHFWTRSYLVELHLAWGDTHASYLWISWQLSSRSKNALTVIRISGDQRMSCRG